MHWLAHKVPQEHNMFGTVTQDPKFGKNIPAVQMYTPNTVAYLLPHLATMRGEQHVPAQWLRQYFKTMACAGYSHGNVPNFLSQEITDVCVLAQQTSQTQHLRAEANRQTAYRKSVASHVHFFEIWAVDPGLFVTPSDFHVVVIGLWRESRLHSLHTGDFEML